MEKLLDEKRRYVINENGALVPSEKGILLWQEIAPMYGSDGNRGVFDTAFTARMEDSLDGIEHRAQEATVVWAEFVEEFSESHSSALEKRRSKPTPKQLSFLKQLLRSLTDEESIRILEGRSLDEIDGNSAKALIDKLTEMNVVAGPSDKQMNLIFKLCDQINITENDASKLVGLESLEELSGGRSGSASQLISKLIAMKNDIPRPPTDKQLSYLRSLLQKAETEESVFCRSRSIESIADMDFNQVSLSIMELRDQLGIKGRGKKRK